MNLKLLDQMEITSNRLSKSNLKKLKVIYTISQFFKYICGEF